MAEKEGALDFGIQQTTEISGDDLFNQMETVTGDPDKVKPILDNNYDEEEETVVAPKKKEVKKKEAVKEEEDEEEEISLLDKILDNKKAAKKTEEAPAEDNEEEPADANPEEDENYFSSITSELFNLGVFTKGEDEDVPEITTGEDFLNLFVNEKKKGAIEILEGVLSAHGQDKRDLFDAVILKGMDPKSYLQKFTEIQDLRSVDLADEGIQERVMREELKAQGWEKADIDEEVEKVKSYGDLESASKRYHKSLIKRTENQLNSEKEAKEQEIAQDAQIQQEYLRNITAIMNAKLKEKEFDGIPLNPALANKVLDSIYTKKWKTQDGTTITDFDNKILRLNRPENHAMKVKLGLLMELLETDPSLSTIQKKAVSRESNSLFSDLEKKKIKKKESAKKEQETSTKSWFS